MFALASLALSGMTSLFVSIAPILIISLGALVNFALSRATQIPKYIRILVLLYQDSSPNSQTRKYTSGALLLLGSLLTFMAHSFVPFTSVPLIGAITTPIALLIALVVLLATLDIITKINEPYFANLETIYSEDFENINDDLLTLKATLGPTWDDLIKKTQKIFDDLSPRITELGKDLSIEINKYFSEKLSELVVYLDCENSSRIVLSESDIQVISESLEPWQKVGSSTILGAMTGTGSGLMASSVVSATLAPAAWWSPLVPGAVQTMLVGGKTVVSSAAFSMYTVAAPIALGLTIGTSVFSATMFTFSKIEEQKLSQFLADVIIASLPMIRADGEFSSEEKISIQQLLANPKIQNKDRKRVDDALHSNDSFEDIIAKNILYEKKENKALMKRRLILAITWEIAKADNNIDSQELILHDRMAKILQISNETVGEIRRIITPKLILPS